LFGKKLILSIFIISGLTMKQIVIVA